jgi:hypothetical protein
MAKIGENYPITRAARKSYLDEIKKGKSIGSSKVPGKGMMDVYRIPLQYLSYNSYNTRFLAQAKTLERRFGCKLSDENPEHIKAIEKFIWEEKKTQNESTINSMIKYGQLQPGVVTADGIILAGNRRYRLLNEISRNPDKYESSKNGIAELDYFEAVILDREKLSEKEIIYYESFYQFEIEEKVEYNPIQKYLASHEQKEMGFTENQIANHFMSITKGEDKVVKLWLEVYDYMEEYLKHIEEEGIYTALEGREEAFLSLRTTIKGFTKGKAGTNIWAFKNFDLDDLKIIFFDYIRLNAPTHDFRLFKDIFSDETHWKKFSDSESKIIGDENNRIESFDIYRKTYPDDDETTISKVRQGDYKDKVEVGLNKLYGHEKARIINEKTQEFPIDILKLIQQKLSKLESDMSSNRRNETYESDEFIDAICDIQKRVGRIKQKVD